MYRIYHNLRSLVPQYGQAKFIKQNVNRRLDRH